MKDINGKEIPKQYEDAYKMGQLKSMIQCYKKKIFNAKETIERMVRVLDNKT